MPRALILASGSPRRKQLLEDLGFRLQVIPPGTEEIWNRKVSPVQNVKRLSREKAHFVAKRLANESIRRPCIILAADTIVIEPLGRKALGKPRSNAEAARMLRGLSNRTHWVYTGYCLLRVSKNGIVSEISRAVGTRVTFRRLSADEIKRYLRTGESKDKAGAYAAQGYGMSLIRAISGSYTNVVGLPLAEVLDDLRNHFGIR